MAELGDTLKNFLENCGGVASLMDHCTRLNTRPSRGAPAGHKHSKLVIPPEAMWPRARTRHERMQAPVYDANITEHRGPDQLWPLHARRCWTGSSRAVVSTCWPPWTRPGTSRSSTFTSRRRSA